MTPHELITNIESDSNYPDIYARENDKLNYLSTLLSSEELTGATFDNFRTVVVPKSIHQQKETSLLHEDLARLELAQRSIQDVSTSDDTRPNTRSCMNTDKKLAGSTVKTADATNRLVDFYAKFITRNLGFKDHDFFH